MYHDPRQKLSIEEWNVLLCTVSRDVMRELWTRKICEEVQPANQESGRLEEGINAFVFLDLTGPSKKWGCRR